jgi:hypothetical protein
MVDETRRFHALSGKVDFERNGDLSPIDRNFSSDGAESQAQLSI